MLSDPMGSTRVAEDIVRKRAPPCPPPCPTPCPRSARGVPEAVPGSSPVRAAARPLRGRNRKVLFGEPPFRQRLVVPARVPGPCFSPAAAPPAPLADGRKLSISLRLRGGAYEHEEQVVAVAGCSVTRAAQLLALAGGDVERAVALHFDLPADDDPAAPAAVPAASTSVAATAPGSSAACGAPASSSAPTSAPWPAASSTASPPIATASPRRHRRGHRGPEREAARRTARRERMDQAWSSRSRAGGEDEGSVEEAPASADEPEEPDEEELGLRARLTRAEGLPQAGAECSAV